MRELVHFYYLWKKSERRDQSFALNDTIDHMDVFINEAGGGNGSGNGNGAGIVSGTANSNGSCSPHSSNGHSNGDLSALEKDTIASPRKPASKSYSIMTGSQAVGNPSGGTESDAHPHLCPWRTRTTTSRKNPACPQCKRHLYHNHHHHYHNRAQALSIRLGQAMYLQGASLPLPLTINMHTVRVVYTICLNIYIPDS